MDKRLLGEFMGTMVLVLMGNGAVANVLLRKSKAEGGGWIVIATGWALAVMSGIFTAVACGSADAHLNQRRAHAAVGLPPAGLHLPRRMADESVVRQWVVPVRRAGVGPIRPRDPDARPLLCAARQRAPPETSAPRCPSP